MMLGDAQYPVYLIDHPSLHPGRISARVDGPASVESDAMAMFGRDCQEWIKTLIDAKVVPAGTRRVIVDIPVDGLVHVYYDTFGTKDLANVDFALRLRDGGLEPMQVTPVPRETKEGT